MVLLISRLLVIPLLVNPTLARILENPTVTIQNGILSGSIMQTWTGDKIFAFRGIPYAKPPVNDLRFKDPVPIDDWSGVRDASKDGPACIQDGTFFDPTSEDCLTVNIYTKKLTGSAPVIVFIHAGAFLVGTGRSDWVGPDYLLEHELVLVTFNYRIGPLGFLSTGDESAPGNYGLKDQGLVLEWIQKNIHLFGGDKDLVTLAGYSAGSSSILLHLLNPSLNRKFSKSILMSGGLSGWIAETGTEALDRTVRLANLVGCGEFKSSTKDLVKCLRSKPAVELAKQKTNMYEWGYEPMVQFRPVIESNSRSAVLTVDPVRALASGSYVAKPTVLGITTNEFDNRESYHGKLLQELNEEFSRIAPIMLFYTKSGPRSQAMSRTIRSHYFGEGHISESNKEAFGKMFSDGTIIFGVERAAKLLMATSPKSVYFYQFGYQGRFSHYNKPGTGIPLGVAHHDDLIYLFGIPHLFPRFNTTDPEAQMVRKMTSFWYNFAANEDPTPDGIAASWQSTKRNDLKHLLITENPTMKAGLPYKRRIAVWESVCLYPRTSEASS